MASLITFLTQILAWLLQFVTWIVVQVFSVVCTAVVAIFSAIPVCGCFATAATGLQSLPSGVLYFAQALDFSTGIQAILCALLMRFLIRRIPFIG